MAKTWVLFNTIKGKRRSIALARLVTSPKKLFKWRLPNGNPYLRIEPRNTFTSRYKDVVMAHSHC